MASLSGASGILLISFLLDGGMPIHNHFQDPFLEQIRGMTPDSVTSRFSSLPRRPFTLKELDIHPEHLYTDHIPASSGSANERMVSNFQRLGNQTYNAYQSLLGTFVTRQRDDDNFTIRIYDKSDNTLEIVTLDSLKQVYKNLGWMDWDAVDRERTKVGQKIKERYRRSGTDPGNLQLRWGRKNQVLEARAREENLITYELRLAKRIGFSSMVTEIGTVETFNQDWLVSSVGARGRYQFMPSMLRRFGIETYDIKNIQGALIKVREERHPLLTMEASFTLAKGYANAVGHELPGVSAYHTGPGNIFKVYQLYLQNRTPDMPVNSVADAFVWGLTTGFPIISRNTTFKTYSQGYIPSLYGSMRAVENLRIDPAKTLKTELISVTEGATITLEELLNILARNGGKNMNWGFGDVNTPLYQRFRALNTQFTLPDVQGDFVPQNGNVVFTRMATNGDEIRFFLPAGASEIIEQAEPDLLDLNTILRYDHTTFLDPVKTGEKTDLDYDYDDLVASIERFGFNQSNKDRLNEITNRMNAAADAKPTQYRIMQARIARLHREVWNTAEWQNLANLVQSLQLQTPPPARPKRITDF